MQISRYVLTLRMSFLVLFVFLTQFLFHEKIYGQTFGANIQLGAIFSQIDGDLSAGYNRPGPDIGLNGTIRIKDQMRIQIGIHYANRGSQTDFIPDNSFEQSKINLGYIDVPITFHFKDWFQKEDDYYRMDFFGGVYYGRLLSVSTQNTVYDDKNDDFSRNEYGLTFGIAYNFNKRNGLGLKWSRGLNNLYDAPSHNYEARSLVSRFINIYYQFTF